MEQLRPVSRTEKIIFPIVVTLLVSFLVPDAAPLVGMLMLGNLMRESGVVDRLVKTAQNELMNIITIFLGVTVGATATDDVFLTLGHHQDRCAGPDCVLPGHCRRRAVRQADVHRHRRQGEPADRLCRCFRGSHGRPCFPEGGRRRPTPPTSCSCTPWAPTWPVLSVPPLRLAY